MDIIYCIETNKPIEYFAYCTGCSKAVMNPYGSGCTTKLLRHKCGLGCGNEEEPLSSYANFSKKDFAALKISAAKYVSYDLKPYSSIDGIGLRNLLKTVYRLGQTNKKINEDQFFNTIPTRNTIKSTICEIANDTRKYIGDLMSEAIRSGGIAVTTDNWTDNHRHATYLAMVAHICIERGDNMKFYRYVLATALVDETVKTGISLSKT